jgi:hypothetical protein
MVSTYGIVFMGTPHQGGNNAQFRKLLLNIASLIVPADDRILSDLKRDSKFLQHQLRQYSQTEKWGLVTKFAYKEFETPTALGRIMVRGFYLVLDSS